MASGTVDYGLVGEQSRFDFGSVGEAVSTLIEACVLLPRNISWGSKYICELIGVIGSNEAIRINKTDFFPLHNK